MYSLFRRVTLGNMSLNGDDTSSASRNVARHLSETYLAPLIKNIPRAGLDRSLLTTLKTSTYDRTSSSYNAGVLYFVENRVPQLDNFIIR